MGATLMLKPKNSFFKEILTVWKQVFTDKGVLTMMIIAPIIYGFFYPFTLFQRNRAKRACCHY